MTKVGVLATGKAFKVPYRTIHFALENGAFAMTYIAPNYANAARWGQLREGDTFSGLRFVAGSTMMIDADSPVARDSGPKCEFKPKPKTLPPQDPQMTLL